MSDSMKYIFSRNLRSQLSLKEVTQKKLAVSLGIPAQTVNNWCKSISFPNDLDIIDRIAHVLSCTRSDLLSDPSEKINASVIIPVLGRVAAGIPLEMIEDIVDEEEIASVMAQKGVFFGLKIKGDSMEPRIVNGDTVIVRKQEDADSGSIVVATINGHDAVCKRLLKYVGGITLISLNPKYEPMQFSNDEIIRKPVRIIGKVVELRAKL